MSYILYTALKHIYCASIGAEYIYITNTKEKYWIQQRLELAIPVSQQFSKQKKIRFLSKLTSAEGLEHYLGAKFPGAKRFFLKGVIAHSHVKRFDPSYRSTGQDTCEVVLGIAHRGRLNVLVNIL